MLSLKVMIALLNSTITTMKNQSFNQPNLSLTPYLRNRQQHVEFESDDCSNALLNTTINTMKNQSFN